MFGSIQRSFYAFSEGNTMVLPVHRCRTDVLRIKIRGSTIAPETVTLAQKDFEEGGYTKLLLDALDVEIASSSALGNLLQLQQRVGKENLIIVCNPPSHLQEILKRTRFSEFFQIVPTIEKAMELLA